MGWGKVLGVWEREKWWGEGDEGCFFFLKTFVLVKGGKMSFNRKSDITRRIKCTSHNRCNYDFLIILVWNAMDALMVDIRCLLHHCSYHSSGVHFSIQAGLPTLPVPEFFPCGH